MSGPYTITITPTLVAVGAHKGLKYLQFIATDGSNTHKWGSVNTGTVAQDLRALFGEWGTGILERLRAGETVKLPRTLTLDEARTIGGAGND